MRARVLLTGEAIRAGRALARLEQTELAQRAGVSLETIKRLERFRGRVEASVRTVDAIFNAFEAVGIGFMPLDKGGIAVCKGEERWEAPPAVHGAGPAIAQPALARAPLESSGQGADGTVHRVLFAARLEREAPPLQTLLEAMAARAAELRRSRGVTGAVIARNGRLLGVIEGGQDSVMQAYGECAMRWPGGVMTALHRSTGAERLFACWSFFCGVFPQGWIHAPDLPLETDFNPEALTPAQALDLLVASQDLELRVPRRHRVDDGLCNLRDGCQEVFCIGDALPRAPAPWAF